MVAGVRMDSPEPIEDDEPATEFSSTRSSYILWRGGREGGRGKEGVGRKVLFFLS